MLGAYFFRKYLTWNLSSYNYFIHFINVLEFNDKLQIVYQILKFKLMIVNNVSRISKSDPGALKTDEILLELTFN